MHDHNRAFLLQIRALSSDFWKGAGEFSSPPPSLSSYAPEQGYREVVIGNLFIIFIMY